MSARWQDVAAVAGARGMVSSRTLPEAIPVGVEEGAMPVPTPMARRMVVGLCTLLLLPMGGSAVSAQSPGVDGLSEALLSVPASADTRGQIVSYVDYRAVEAARPGAAHPASYAALEALRAEHDASARLWLAASLGVASGSGDLLRTLAVGGDRWPSLLGFDFFDVDREIAFGAPPSDGLALLGRFDPAAITRAFGARDYTAAAASGWSLLCGPDGCDGGTRLHVDQVDPGDPFGGALGRLQPLAVSASELLGSASGETVRAMLDASGGRAPSLGADPAYRAAAEALAADGTIIQATLVPGGSITADVASLLIGGSDTTKGALEQLTATFEPIPPYELAAFADGASATEQVVRVALVYDAAADAQRALDVLPRRLDSLPSLEARMPLRQLLDERGVSAVDGRVVPSSDGTRSVALLTLRAPLASTLPDPGTGLMTSSSLVYHLLVSMLYSRDTLWLAPTLPGNG